VGRPYAFSSVQYSSERLNTQGEIKSEAGLSSAKAIELGDLIGNPQKADREFWTAKSLPWVRLRAGEGFPPPTHYFLWHSLHFVGTAVPFAAIALWQV
jgi:hypothetical protein